DRPRHLSRRANAAHHRSDGRGGREPLSRADANRNTPPRDPVSANQRVHVLENMIMLSRRAFLHTTAAIAAAAPPAEPKRIAIIATIYRLQSHAQHMGDRFLVGYPYAGTWHKPNMRVVSLYVDQKPEGDLSGERAREFGLQVYPTIPEALRCGGSALAVDAVLIIAEHGNYPRNEKGQILYPRYEFFEQCARGFE